MINVIAFAYKWQFDGVVQGCIRQAEKRYSPWEQLEIAIKCGNNAIPVDRLLWPNFRDIVAGNIPVDLERAQAIGYPLAFLIATAQSQLVSRRIWCMAHLHLYGCNTTGCAFRGALKGQILTLLTGPKLSASDNTILAFSLIAQHIARVLGGLCAHLKVTPEQVIGWTDAGTEKECDFLREFFNASVLKVL